MSEPELGARQLERLREGLTQPSGGSSEAPVDPEHIWAAVRGELEPAQRDALVDRLARDPQLALEWRMAVELHRAEQGEAEAPTRIEPAVNGSGYLYYAALGLAAAAALVLIVMPRGQDDVEPPVMRAAEEQPMLSTPLPEDAKLERGDFRLRWSARRQVSHYELRVSTEALEPVYVQTYVESEQLRVPVEAFEELESGTVLLWQVEAVESDGTRHTSPLHRVVLR